MRQKERDRFVREASKLIRELGAYESVTDPYYVHLQTKCGTLLLHVSENAVDGPGTVFGRFDEPERAGEFVECNPYSGKWNNHYFDGWSVDAALADLRRQITRLI